MDKPPRPFTAERRMEALSGAEDTVTNRDLLDALDKLSADAGKTNPPPPFTSERRSGKLSASADAISNRDLLDAFNNLSNLLGDIVAEQWPPADGGGEPPEEAPEKTIGAPAGWERAKREIAALKSANADEDRLVLARREIETVVAATDAAANEIMNLSDAVQEVSGKLRGEPGSAEPAAAESAAAAAKAHSDTLDEIATNLMIACSFQDLTGQRLNKVANALQALEDQVDGLFRTLDISAATGEGGLLAYTADDERPDKKMLHGPQDEGEGISQAEIDAMFD